MALHAPQLSKDLVALVRTVGARTHHVVAKVGESIVMATAETLGSLAEKSLLDAAFARELSS